MMPAIIKEPRRRPYLGPLLAGFLLFVAGTASAQQPAQNRILRVGAHPVAGSAVER